MQAIDLSAPLLLAGALIPFATAALTKWRAPDAVKGVVTITLSAVVAVAHTLAGDTTWHAFASAFAMTWCTALVTWLGATGDFTARLNQATGSFGLGGSTGVEPLKPTPEPDYVPQHMAPEAPETP